MTFLAATDNDIYRKPSPEMWRYFVHELNEGVKVDTDLSFYCGDAAGRPKTNSKPKDFSDGDLKFAINAKLPFFVPEDMLGGSPVALQNHLEGVPLTKKQVDGEEAKGETAKVGMPVGSGLGLEQMKGPVVKGGQVGDELAL